MRVGVLGAGGPAGVNVCRSLHQAGHDVVGVDRNEAHLIWAVPFCISVGTEWTREDADVWHAQPDGLVRALAVCSNSEEIATLLPSLAVLRKCREKLAAIEAWQEAGLRTGAQRIGAETADWLHLAKDRFGLPFWLRASDGAGARGATLATDLGVAFHWIRYWESRKSPWTFIAEEYLPGPEFCFTSLWYRGELIGSFLRERLEWIYPHLSPSGRTGTPSISQTVLDPDVSAMAKLAIDALDPEPNGIYCVDLVCDADGQPRPTEINAGRWATTSPLYSELGVNLQDAHARLAAGEIVPPLGEDLYAPGIRLSRHIDCGYVFEESAVCV